MKQFLKLLLMVLACFVMPLCFALIFGLGFYTGWNDGVVPIASTFGAVLPHINYGIWVFAYLIFSLFYIPFARYKNEDSNWEAWGKIFTKVFGMYCLVLLVLIIKSIVI